MMATLIVEPASDINPPRRSISLAEFNALPDDPAWDRFVIRGKLWEVPMTKRNRRHARIEAMLAFLLNSWLRERHPGFGAVFSGEVGCDFPELDTGVGIDVAVFSAETLAVQVPQSAYIVGAPVLAVEILSSSDTIELTVAKISVYHEAGTPLVWIVDPSLQTVTVHPRGGLPTMYRGDDEFDGEPHLPGLRLSIRSIFS